METLVTHSYEEIQEEMDATHSILNLSGNSTAGQIRILKDNQFCKHAKTNLKILEIKTQSLLAAKCDALRTRNELLLKQKINEINLRSLAKTRNEFFNYKSDVKTNYIQEQIMLKNRRMKYMLFTASYTKNWEAVERENRKIPLAAEIFNIQTENMCLEAQSIGLQSLLKKTEKDYSREIRNYEISLITKIVEFVKESQIYFNFLKINQNIRNITIRIEKILNLRESQNQKPGYIADILRKSSLEIIIHGDPNRQSIDKESFSANLREFDNMLIPLENLPLETLEISFEDDSFIHSNEIVGSVDNPENLDSEKGSSNINSPILESHCHDDNRPAYIQEVNTHNNDSNENMGSTGDENENNTENQNIHANDVPDNLSIIQNDQYEQIFTPPKSGDVSQYWNRTEISAEVNGTGVAAGKVKEDKNCKPKTLQIWKETGGTNPKKRKYSNRDNDSSTSLSPVENPRRENPKPILNNYMESLQGNRMEAQSSCTEILTSKDKVENQKELSFSSGFWNINQVLSENKDKNEEINYFSFLSAGDDSDRTKTGMGSSIFTLF